MAKKKSKKNDSKIDPAIRKEWLAKVEEDIFALESAPEEIKSDHEIVLAAVKQDRNALRHASEGLRSDPKFMLTAVNQDGQTLEHASKSLKSNPKIVLAAVKQEGYAFEYASKNMKSDPKIVLAAVMNHGMALQYASKSLKSDSKIVLAAVKQDGYALEYASKSMKSDSKIVLAAVMQDGPALEYASKDLQDDPEIVLAAVKQDGWTLYFASKSMKSDPKIVLAAVKENGSALEYASKSMKSDPKIVLAAVKQYGRALEYASENLKSDPKIVLAAVKQDGESLEHASKSLKSDSKFVLEVVKQCGSALRYADVTKMPFEIQLAAVKQNGLALQFVSNKLTSDSKIVNVAISKNPDAIQYADESYTANQIIVIDNGVATNNLDFNSVGFKIGIKKDLGVPIKCSASYSLAYSSDKEYGVFMGVGDGRYLSPESCHQPEESVDVEGYIIWTEKTWGDLIWELPKSTEDCIDAIEQKNWVWWDENHHPKVESSASDRTNFPFSHRIMFDECTFGEEGSDGVDSERVAWEAIILDGPEFSQPEDDYEEISPSDDEVFQCDDSYIIERSGSSYPYAIAIEYDSGFKIELASNTAAKWTGKLNMDSTTVLMGTLKYKYENVLKVVRHFLEDVDSKNTFDSIIAKLLELNN